MVAAFLSRHQETQCWDQLWMYVVKSTRGEVARGPARGWGITTVLMLELELEAMRGPRLMAAD